MKHILPELPYALNALEPYISQETLEFHYGKHHRAYVDKLNELIEGTEFADMSLQDIVDHAPKGPIFNNAAQIINHTFYFNSLHAPDDCTPDGALLEALVQKWGSFEDFVADFSAKAIANFGSGWTWLAKNTQGALEIINTSNAETIIGSSEYIPLLVCDVWEHAYYIDTRNARAKYIENFWCVVHWNVVGARFSV